MTKTRTKSASSNRVNFGLLRQKKEWRSRVSIPVPADCEPTALPSELHPLLQKKRFYRIKTFVGCSPLSVLFVFGSKKRSRVRFQATGHPAVLIRKTPLTKTFFFFKPKELKPNNLLGDFGSNVGFFVSGVSASVAQWIDRLLIWGGLLEIFLCCGWEQCRVESVFYRLLDKKNS